MGLAHVLASVIHCVMDLTGLIKSIIQYMNVRGLQNATSTDGKVW